DPVKRVLIDYVGGLDDLHRGVVRAIGAANERFGEDHLRMLRAIRFAARLRFELAPDTWRAIGQGAHLVSRVSAERIFAEVTKILTDPHPDVAFRMLDTSGLLAVVLPELIAMKGVA